MFEKINFYVRTHASELAIFTVMVAVSVGIALAAGGDVGEALARRRH